MTRTEKYPVKLTGSINWSWETEDDVLGIEVKRAIIRSEDEIVLACETSGYMYNIFLRRNQDSRFEGNFQVSKGPDAFPVVAECTLYWNERGYLLFGSWLENGYESRWWAELLKVDRFADEKSE